MSVRKVLLAVALAAPLALIPSDSSAQEHGLAQAEISTAQAESVAAWYHNNATRRPRRLPPGISRRIQVGEPLPPGIGRTRIPEAALPDSPEGGDAGDGGDGEDGGDVVIILMGSDLVLYDAEADIVLDIEYDIF